MKAFDLYAVDTADLDAARALVEAALAVRFEARESSYHCGDYYRHGPLAGEHFVLQRNYDPLEEEWTSAAHKEVPFLLFINETARSEALRAILERHDRIRLLVHEEL